jgi:hypothetical protein
MRKLPAHHVLRYAVSSCVLLLVQEFAAREGVSRMTKAHGTGPWCPLNQFSAHPESEGAYPETRLPCPPHPCRSLPWGKRSLQ